MSPFSSSNGNNDDNKLNDIYNQLDQKQMMKKVKRNSVYVSSKAKAKIESGENVL